MSPRKPNMLEAFQASAKAEQAKRAEAEASEAATEQEGTSAPGSGNVAGVGGPFAVGEGAAGKKAVPAAQAADTNSASPTTTPGDVLFGTTPPSRELNQARLPLLIGGVLLAMLLMFILGRRFGSSDETLADGPDVSQDIGELAGNGASAGLEGGPVSSNERPSADPGASSAAESAKGSGLTTADRAFLDRQNRFSVRAIQFDNDKRGSELALSAYRYLYSKGLPAVTPITQGSTLVICVGAEPSQNAEIKRIQTELAKLNGPPPGDEPGAVRTAYVVNISDQIDDKHRR